MSDCMIKICGLTTPETLDAAVDAGATHVGFVYYEKSPRHLSLEAAAKLRRRVPSTVKLVLVQVALAPQEFARVCGVVEPDVIQFHGQENPQWMAMVKEHTGIETWRSFGLKEAATLERAREYQGVVDRILFDAPAQPLPGSLPGGNGVAARWELLESWQPFMPWALAGGLDPDNVGEAIRRTKAPLVDASSGLETAPGVKSPELIRKFCDAVRAA